MANYGKVPEGALDFMKEREGGALAPEGHPDRIAFDAMNKLSTKKASNLFRESAYNALSTDKERTFYDKKAYDILKSMYTKDKTKRGLENIPFDKYVPLLSPALFEERALYPRDEDEEMGDFFLDVYEGDFDQFKASALKHIPAGRKKSLKSMGKYVG